ncbi:6-hydroxymethylpterin diphosphokinase MptE-like protein [Gottfriedia acidiceleris]|uniref:6-hydroxymethylpterin diphosphokinase MptE-like protein n=1 Tax=Gottfriedia acidiceleris TaxID=371036 RepID=UPI001F161D19|nr:6-hydroxymethylpterin diphosphokinase MptE-like protein [Gottfriedia acidiceleris]
MILKLYEALRKNRFTYFFIYHISRTKTKLLNHVLPRSIFNLNKFFRVIRLYKNSQYEQLKLVKNKHKGQRCFIVATGPSLTTTDLELLKEEVTLSMNSICLVFDETDWRPTYYGIQDVGVFNLLQPSIEKYDLQHKFISNSISKQKQVTKGYLVFPLNLLNHMIFHKKYKTKFSGDAFKVIYDGYSITYSMIQLAVYMGFSEIYLLGVDCNYSLNSPQHFKDYGYKETSSEAVIRMISAYKEAKKYAERNQIKIYNATRGGMLDVFERVNLDDILNKNDNQPLLSKRTI